MMKLTILLGNSSTYEFLFRTAFKLGAKTFLLAAPAPRPPRVKSRAGVSLVIPLSVSSGRVPPPDGPLLFVVDPLAPLMDEAVAVVAVIRFAGMASHSRRPSS